LRNLWRAWALLVRSTNKKIIRRKHSPGGFPNPAL
jgi:hypothetical protein